LRTLGASRWRSKLKITPPKQWATGVIHNGRRVVLVKPRGYRGLALSDRQLVDLVTSSDDGIDCRAKDFRLVAYPAARGSAASYYPETNVLVPLDSVAEFSNTPTSKGVFVRLEPAGA
jgi:hypothetical protein